MWEQGDLFGYVPPAPAKPSVPARKAGPLKGHAWPPGTGPEGETCKSCRHYVVRHMAKTNRKCWLTRAQWGRRGTDIRASDPACLKWEAKE